MTSAFSDRFIQGRSGFAKVEYRAMSNVKDGDLHAYLTAPYILKEQCRIGLYAIRQTVSENLY